MSRVKEQGLYRIELKGEDHKVVKSFTVLSHRSFDLTFLEGFLARGDSYFLVDTPSGGKLVVSSYWSKKSEVIRQRSRNRFSIFLKRDKISNIFKLPSMKRAINSVPIGELN